MDEAEAPPLGGIIVDRGPVRGLSAINRVELCAAGAVSFCATPLAAGALTVCLAILANVSLKLVLMTAIFESSSRKAAYMASCIMHTVLPRGRAERNYPKIARPIPSPAK